MTEREYEDMYIDRDWDDYADDMPDYDEDPSFGWYEDDYDYLDDLDDYSYDDEH